MHKSPNESWEKTEANARFIVKAVNNHERLVEALEKTLAALEAWVEIADDEDDRQSDHDAIVEAQALLSDLRVYDVPGWEVAAEGIAVFISPYPYA